MPFIFKKFNVKNAVTSAEQCRTMQNNAEQCRTMHCHKDTAKIIHEARLIMWFK